MARIYQVKPPRLNVVRANGWHCVGKPREPLNYAGGIPLYKQALEDDRHRHYEGFVLQ